MGGGTAVRGAVRRGGDVLAVPLPIRHVFFAEMHELPHGIPLRQFFCA